ncbi:hypothetical protein HF1_12320 [Mycoplasma haemofelis str. Langford 1]|uniref:Uncharacterized protein n=1 Tax=Mycoplasma haemofelis (strain Langford 1) TaxID=941640 RepID=E8ZJB9_MYCHL|nr:hypothetical protein [Mycoplasma haemofelis]CBY93240.1 hypothetical protein HF1_12320 [Mycoplasma haemofelis str. Langford 1]
MKITLPLLLGGAAATSAAAFGGYHYLSSKETPIREVLKGSKLISDLPASVRAEQWGLELESDLENIKKSIPELKVISGKEDGIQKLSAWCSKSMELDSQKNEEVLSLAKKYCLIRNIESQLSRKGLTLLGEDGEKWKATYNARKGSQKSKRSDVGLKGEWKDSNEEQDLATIKSWCASTREKDFLASDKEDLYVKSVMWCTEEGVADA